MSPSRFQRKTKNEDSNVGRIGRSLGIQSNFSSTFDLGKILGSGSYGTVHMAKLKKGMALINTNSTQKDFAVKIIPKKTSTTCTNREICLLRGLSGSEYTVQFHGSFEDEKNIYIVMELCQGGHLRERMPNKGGGIAENDAKDIIIKLLGAISYLHLQGVVHRDLKPENLLFTTKAKKSTLKVVDFGLSDFVTPDKSLDEIVGTPHYIAPEMLDTSYNNQVDCWSVGVITYFLLSGTQPFDGKTVEAIFHSVRYNDPVLSGFPWSSLSPHATSFLKLLLNKDPKKRMTASQALAHPWLWNEKEAATLDINIYKQLKSYFLGTPLKCLALKALSKALSEDELLHITCQFKLMEPINGLVSSNNFKKALMKHFTPVMKEAKVSDIVYKIRTLPPMTLEEFSAAAICPHQLETLQRWETIAKTAFNYFNKLEEGNRIYSADELAQELEMSGTDAGSTMLDEEGKLNFLGFTKLLLANTI